MSFDEDSFKAASPVIGLLLMIVVVAVLLFVLGGSGSGAGQGPEAEIVFSQIGSGNVEGVVTSDQRVDSLTVEVEAQDGTSGIEMVIEPVSSGSTFYYCDGEEGDRLVITATYDGADQLLRDYTLKTGTSNSGSLSNSSC